MNITVHRRAVLAGLTAAGLLTGGLLASGSAAAAARLPRSPGARAPAYTIVQLGSLGGSASAGNSINDRGWIAGTSNLPGDKVTRAVVWRGGRLVRLGTLGGPDSAVLWPVKDTSGVVFGVSETAAINKLGESWSCSFFFPSVTHHVCRGFVWLDGRMHGLPTFGGPDSFAAGANRIGQVVGWAENTVRDPTCTAPQVLQFRAAVWDVRRHTMRQLRPLPGDSSSAATDINDHGVAVGISGSCDIAVGEFTARHAVEWSHGMVYALPTLGAPSWNTPSAINDRGEAVGFVNAPGGAPAAFSPLAALWTPDRRLRLLGTLPGSQTSQALGINAAGQVVGQSCPAGNAPCSAVLWQHGRIYRLRTLASGAPGLHLLSASDINDAGVITGQAQTSSNQLVAYLAIPRHG